MYCPINAYGCHNDILQSNNIVVSVLGKWGVPTTSISINEDVWILLNKLATIILLVSSKLIIWKVLPLILSVIQFSYFESCNRLTGMNYIGVQPAILFSQILKPSKRLFLQQKSYLLKEAH